MIPTADNIESLTELLIHYFWSRDAVKSLIISEKLSGMLGPPSDRNEENYPEQWVLIYETRNQMQDAIRVADHEISRRRAAIMA